MRQYGFSIRAFFSLLILGICLPGSRLKAQTKKPWLNNWTTAKNTAVKSQKNILIKFTGSDWCPPCKQLEKSVYSNPTFMKHASNRWVLLELDFPRQKQLPSDQKRHNAIIQSHFKVTGFPTLILVTPEKEVIHRQSGYGGQKASDFYKKIKAADEKHKKSKSSKNPSPPTTKLDRV